MSTYRRRVLGFLWIMSSCRCFTRVVLSTDLARGVGCSAFDGIFGGMCVCFCLGSGGRLRRCRFRSFRCFLFPVLCWSFRRLLGCYLGPLCSRLFLLISSYAVWSLSLWCVVLFFSFSSAQAWFRFSSIVSFVCTETGSILWAIFYGDIRYRFSVILSLATLPLG